MKSVFPHVDSHERDTCRPNSPPMSEGIRLVIWDLDDTFWKGTLDEGPVELDEANHTLVQDLSRRGIINSICSKNDQTRAELVLRNAGIWDYFILPSINWLPKGERVAAQVSQFGLRAPSVLFLDDNPLNCADVAAATPGIITADAEFARQLSTHPKLVGRPDPQLTRLKHYRVLEEALRERANHRGDSQQFLRSSGIQARIEYDLEPHIDRVVDLINRTNRLNFTKERLSGSFERHRQSMLEQVRFFGNQVGLVEVEDRFGSHGFVGFFLKTIDSWEGSGILKHFCFSCRVLGLGVEKWTYDFLGRPALAPVAPDMRELLDGPKVDWINAGKQVPRRSGSSKPSLKVRLRGNCVVSALAHYFRPAAEHIELETNQPSEVWGIYKDTSTSLASLLVQDDEYLASLRRLNFPQEALYTGFVDKSEGNLLLVANFWGDLVVPRYRNRCTGKHLHVSIPGRKGPLLEDRERDILSLSKAELTAVVASAQFDRNTLELFHRLVKMLRRDYEFCERITEVELKENLCLIIAHLPSNAELVIILPPTRTVSGAELPLAAAYCRWCREAVLGRPQVSVVSTDEQILREHEHGREGEDHFDRIVYYRLAQAVLAKYCAVSNGRSEID